MHEKSKCNAYNIEAFVCILFCVALNYEFKL